jgi:hypothetical protein
MVFTAVLPQKCLKFFRLGLRYAPASENSRIVPVGEAHKKTTTFLTFSDLWTLFFSLLLPVYNAYSNHFARIFKLKIVPFSYLYVAILDGHWTVLKQILDISVEIMYQKVF